MSEIDGGSAWSPIPITAVSWSKLRVSYDLDPPTDDSTCEKESSHETPYLRTRSSDSKTRQDWHKTTVGEIVEVYTKFIRPIAEFSGVPQQNADP